MEGETVWDHLSNIQPNLKDVKNTVAEVWSETKSRLERYQNDPWLSISLSLPKWAPVKKVLVIPYA